MPLFRLSIAMTFIQGGKIQPFNPFRENRSLCVACQARQYLPHCGQKRFLRWKFNSLEDMLKISEQEEVRQRSVR
jgi:hypothetical protein